MTALRDLPRVDLPDSHHQQVRQLLVREARTTSVRSLRLRVAVPLLAAGAVAGVVGVAAVGPGAVVRAVGEATGLTAPVGEVSCETGAVTVDAAQADGVRYLLGAPGDLQVAQAWSNATPLCEASAAVPVQVVADVADDGVVQSSVVLRRGDVRPDVDLPAADGMPVPTRTDGSVAEGSGSAWSTTVVRGGDALVFDLLAGEPDLRGSVPPTLQVWWSEQGESWSVTTSGLTPADVLDRVEGLDLASPAPLGTDDALAGWSVEQHGAAEVVWYAEYVGGPAPASVGADERVEGAGSRYGIQLRVDRLSDPWQTRLTAGDRIVDIAGRTGVYGTRGGGGLVPQALWDTADGAQVELSGWVDGGEEALLAAARSLEPVAADDPRIVAPAPDHS